AHQFCPFRDVTLLPLASRHSYATLRDMGDRTQSFKRTVAALLLTVGFSIPALADEARLDDLFGQLREADAQAAALIEAEIRTEWSKSGSAAVDLLLRRAQDALDLGNY